ncbi:MAG: hypothetical protein M0P69_11455 [Bacteroidales bacterium]|nr:hypothetical protein [Bacteroidales bacterium]
MTTSNNTLTRSQMMHKVGNVPVIGYTFALQLKQPMYSRDTVLNAALRQGFDTKEFPEPTKRNSFKNAMRAQMKLKKESEKILHFVEETATGVIFQIDRKVLENVSLWGSSSDGGETQIETKSASYQKELQVVYDKTSDRVICDSAEVLQAVYKLLGVYMESYTKLTLTRYILNLLERNTSFVPYIKGTGVYFVPAHNRTYLDKIVEFMYDLDNCTNTVLCEIPDLPNAQEAIAASTTEKFADMRRDQETEILKFVEESAQMTERMKENRLTDIAKRGEVIRNYEILLNKELRQASKSLKATELMVKNFYKYGTITNPFQAIVDENKDNAEAIQRIKDSVPDDVLELLDFS